MTKSPLRRSAFAMAAVTAVALFHVAASRTIAQKTPVTTSGVTGTWEIGTDYYGPWVFRLHAEGDVLTGQVWEEGGLTGPADIFDGRINGSTLALKYHGISEKGPKSVDLTVELTGTIRKSSTGTPNEIAFKSRVESTGVYGDGRGLFGSQIAKSFSAKRSNPAIVGKVIVEGGFPRPVFQARFFDAKGKRFDPVTAAKRGVGPFGASLATAKGPGGPFDPAPREGWPEGNSSRFVVRLPPGEYRPAIALPNGYILQSVRAGAVDLKTERLQVAADRNTAEVIITLAVNTETWVRVSGRVANAATRTSAAGQGAQLVVRGGIPGPFISPARNLILISDALSEYLVAPIAPNGAFEFPRVPPGAFGVRALPDTRSTPVLNLNVPGRDLLGLEITVPNIPGCYAC
jgi:hypothetical protein